MEREERKHKLREMLAWGEVFFTEKDLNCVYGNETDKELEEYFIQIKNKYK